MKRFLLIFVLLFGPGTAFADCNIKNIGLGQKFSELKNKYNINDDSTSEHGYYKNIRGSDICKEMDNTEVSILFLKDSAALIEIYRKSADDLLLGIASKNFGEPSKLPNKESPELKSYATYWDNKAYVVTYSLSLLKNENIYSERLVFEQKDLAEDLVKFFTSEEKEE